MLPGQRCGRLEVITALLIVLSASSLVQQDKNSEAQTPPTFKIPVNVIFVNVFRIHNLSGSRDSWKLSANANLIGENGRESVLADLPLDQNLSRVGEGEAVVALILSPKNSLPGRFKLVVELSDAATGEKATARTDVEFY
jgi:hypothetical protein